MDNLERSILAAVTYFDLHDHALSAWEIWRWLLADGGGQDVGPMQVMQKLGQSTELSSRLESCDGFHFLKGRQELVRKRQERYRLTAGQAKAARRLAWVFARLPFFEAVFGCNGFGFDGLDAGSDMDFFIVAKKGRIYLVRLTAIIVTALLGLRPTAKTKAGKACLSFFVSDDGLDLGRIRQGDDIYLTYWLATLYPFFGWEKYPQLAAANSAMLSRLPNSHPCLPGSSRRVTVPRRWRRLVDGWLAGRIGDALERAARKIQAGKISAKLAAAASDSSIIADDHMLKFHEHDRRASYQKRFDDAMLLLCHSREGGNPGA